MLMSRAVDHTLRNEVKYSSLVSREEGVHAKTIARDICRTFPTHQLFSDPSSSTGQRELCRILNAFSLYDTSVGYCQVTWNVNNARSLTDGCTSQISIDY